MKQIVRRKSFIQRGALFIMATVLLLTGTNTGDIARASFYSDNDIFHYNKDFSEIEACGGADGFEDTGENLKSIFNYLIKRGLSDAQAAGVIGNIKVESNGDPQVIQGGKRTDDPSSLTTTTQGYGIIQWTPGNKLLNYMKQFNVSGSPGDLETQLQVLWKHMTIENPSGDKENMVEDASSKYPAFKSIKSEAEAASVFHYRVERSADKSMENRISAAKNALEQYGGQSTDPDVIVETNSSPTGCSGSSEGNGSIVDTALEYSWPTNFISSRPHPQKTPAYEAAHRAAVAEGKYYNRTSGVPGVDCGAFVTRVMQNSGVDPEYNNKKGNTTVQKQYLESNPEKYKRINVKTEADLQPGDIGVRGKTDGPYGHTFIYVGKNDKFKGGERIAESSISMRLAPQAGWTRPADPSFAYFRFIGGEPKTNGN